MIKAIRTFFDTRAAIREISLKLNLIELQLEMLNQDLQTKKRDDRIVDHVVATLQNDVWKLQLGITEQNERQTTERMPLSGTADPITD